MLHFLLHTETLVVLWCLIGFYTSLFLTYTDLHILCNAIPVWSSDFQFQPPTSSVPLLYQDLTRVILPCPAVFCIFSTSSSSSQPLQHGSYSRHANEIMQNHFIVASTTVSFTNICNYFTWHLSCLILSDWCPRELGVLRHTSVLLNVGADNSQCWCWHLCMCVSDTFESYFMVERSILNKRKPFVVNIVNVGRERADITKKSKFISSLVQ